MREHENVDTSHVRQDPAIRLMVYQLAHLFGVAGAQYDLVHYMTDEAACRERLAALGLKPFGAA
jgi:hypothetical protein